MRLTLPLAFLVLLVAGCHRNDAKLSRQIVGTWAPGAGISMAISPDGSFLSAFTKTNLVVVLTYQGTWLVRDGELVMTITNASGTKEHEPVGSIDRMKIVQVDAARLALGMNGQTNYFERK